MFNLPSPLDPLNSALLTQHNVQLWIKRDDLIHPVVSGNKWRKLAGYIEQAQAQQKSILSFGGAYSNHLHALAYAGQQFNIKCHALVRGESSSTLNPTLSDCIAKFMTLEFIDRKTYKLKENKDFLFDLQKKFPNYLIVPEGGYGKTALNYTANIVNELTQQTTNALDYIVTPVGSGTTLAGLITGVENARQINNSTFKPTQIIGIAAIAQADYLIDKMSTLLPSSQSIYPDNWQLWTDSHLGGFAKLTDELCDFIQVFYQTYQITLDPIYTGKTLLALFKAIKQGQFDNQKIVVLHTGGTQGWRGFYDRNIVNKNYLQSIGISIQT